MFVRKIVGGLTGLTATGVKTGVGTAERLIGHGRSTAVGAATVGTTVAGTVVRSTVGRLRPPADRTQGHPQQTPDEAGETRTTADEAVLDEAVPNEVPPAETPAKRAPRKKATVKDSSGEKSNRPEDAEVAPRTVTAADLPLPDLPDEPPVDVVEQALAAEDSGEHLREGFATEPKGASRDEAHGDAALQRAEVDELAEEVAEASAEGRVDIETPVGTTGADVGFNPDTAEADLQQPGTEPLVDPSLTKQVIADAKIGAGDADVPKRG